MSRRASSVHNAHFSGGLRSALRGIALAWMLAASGASATGDQAEGGLRLELTPRVCTLGAHDSKCETVVHAAWAATRDESLCVVIVNRPDVKRCWEHFAEGTYDVHLVFTDDLVFQLKDLDLQRVLTSETLRVIREALQYRHRRRQPWSLFE